LEKNFHIWDGIYSSFLEANTDVCGLGFHGKTWEERSIKAANECIEALKENKPIPFFHKQRCIFLPSSLAMMIGTHEKLKVLDMGGGLGIGHMTIAESMPDHVNNIQYTIVEVPEICKVGKELFSKNSNVTYLESVPCDRSFDFVYSASTLQYIEEWQQTLKSLGNTEAKYILLSDIFAGDIPTFVTLQNYYDSKIQHWFLNINELISVMASIGYELVMKCSAPSLRINIENILPMNNFPKSHRLKQTAHLLFNRRM
tara:strand:+ start:400 stop:1170 length:771 start_codon:yes stop_codon:yes gene_type:complete